MYISRPLDRSTGDLARLICGSLEIDVITGSIVMDLGSMTAEPPAGTFATIAETAPGTFVIANSPASSGSIHVGLLPPLGPGESLTLDVVGPAEALQSVIDNLRAIVGANPGTPLADTVEDVLANAENALTKLSKTPPHNEAAAAKIKCGKGARTGRDERAP